MGSIIAERVKGATLTKAQRKIAKYFIHNPERVGMSSSMEVARAIGVSDASITRFARAIGYEGFTDLKADIYNSLVNQATAGTAFDSFCNSHIRLSYASSMESLQTAVSRLKGMLKK